MLMTICFLSIQCSVRFNPATKPWDNVMLEFANWLGKEFMEMNRFGWDVCVGWPSVMISGGHVHLHPSSGSTEHWTIPLSSDVWPSPWSGNLPANVSPVRFSNDG